MSVKVRVKVDDPGAHEKKRGQEGRASFKVRRETELLYTDVGFVHCTKHPGRGFVRLTWKPHSTHKTVFLARGWICLKERTLTDRGQRGMAL